MKTTKPLILSFLFMAACGDDSAPADAAVGDAGACGPFTDPITTPTLDTYDNFAQAFFSDYCVRCHSSTLTTPAERRNAPPGLNWDQTASIDTNASRIRSAVGVIQFMPFDAPFPSCDERRRLVHWIDAGLP
jgi:uncharacterized membrane protein